MPTEERQGDTWVVTWDEHGVGIAIERLRETRDALKAEVTVSGMTAGRVLGPNVVDLLSARSQAEFANACAKRVNGLNDEEWRHLVVHACALVAREYRKPTPTVSLSDAPDEGPIQYVIPQLIPKSETTVMYGDGESAKSLLAVRIAFSVATGQDVPWGHEVTRGNVLYCDWETNLATVASRLRRVSRAMETPVPDNIFYKQCFRSLLDELSDIREQIARKTIALVIIDSLGFAASGALVEDETARSAMNAMRQMAPATRLAVAHVSKGSAESGGAVKPFGSAFFWNGMRSGIEIRRSDEAYSDRMIDVGIYHRKSNDGRHAKPIGLSVVFEENRSIMFDHSELVDVPDLASRAPLAQRIRELLKRGAQTTSDLALDLDAKEDSVKKTLQRMDGVIQLRPGGGRGHSAEWGLAQ